MVKLVETNSVLIGRQLNIGQQPYVEVSAIGDGNCAFNAFALGLIDLVQRRQLTAKDDEKQLNDLLAAIQEKANLNVLIERQKHYANKNSQIAGNAYEDIADELAEFITFVQSKPSVGAFVSYIRDQQSRFSIAALHVAFAPALRQMGVDFYVESLERTGLAKDDELFTEANYLKSDSEFAGQDVLLPLAKKFNVNIQTKIDRKNNASVVAGNSWNTARPTISLVHVPGHYNYAYPQGQDDGLALSLRDFQHNPSDDYTADLVLLSQEHQAQIQNKNNHKKLISKNQMIEVANLASLESEVILENKERAKVLDASIAAMTDAVKQNIVNHTENGESAYRVCVEQLLDRQAAFSAQSSTPYYKEAVKGLLFNGVRKPEAGEVSEDETLARALQNAEILEFLKENFDELTANKKQPDQSNSLRRR